MGRKKRLSAQEQAQVDVMKQLGLSVNQMSKQLGRTRCAIANYLSNPLLYGTKKPPGRPSMLTDREKREIIRLASNSLKSAREIKDELGISASPTTVRRTIHSSPHIVRQTLMKAPRLHDHHKQGRLRFCRANMQRDWSKVVFSDEKKFTLDGPDGFHSYWRDLRKEPEIFSRRNFGGGSVMTWAAFSSHGVLEIAFPSSKMDSAEYQDVLKDHLLPYMRRFRRFKLTFQQDNASIHASASTKAWFRSNNITILDWPACSPDFNPMENMWAIIARRVYHNGKQYSSIRDLKAAILAEWAKIDQKTIDSLVNSMPDRIYEAIARRGSQTKY